MDDNVKNEITLLINESVESDVSECIRFGRDWIFDPSSIYSRLDVTHHPDKGCTDIFGVIYLDDRLLPSMPISIRYWLYGKYDEEIHDAPQSNIRYRIHIGLIGDGEYSFDMNLSSITVCEIFDREEIEGRLRDER